MLYRFCLCLFFFVTSANAWGEDAVHNFRDWNGETLDLVGEWQVLPGFAGAEASAALFDPQATRALINRPFSQIEKTARPLQAKDSATFMFKLQNLPVGDYGLRVRVDTAAAVYLVPTDRTDPVQEVLHIGKPGPDAGHTIPEVADPLGLFHIKASGDYLLILHVANFHYPNGMVWKGPTLGSYGRMKSQWMLELIQEAFCFGVIAILAIYNLALFLNRPEDQSNLWLAGYCLFALLRFVGISAVLLPALFPEPSLLMHAIARKCEIGMPAISAACLSGFAVYNFHHTPRFALISKILLAIGGLFAATMLGLDTALLPHFIPLLDLILVGSFLLTLSIIGRAVRERATGSLTFLLGIITFGAFASYDIAVGLQFFSSRYYLSSFGLVIFIFCQGQVVAKLFSKAFRTAERLTAHLEEEVEHKTRDIKSMLDNIPLGICSIDRQGRIMPSFSSHLPEFLDDLNPAGRSLIDLLFALGPLPHDQQDIIQQSLQSILGEDLLNFSLNAEHLPNEWVFQSGKYIQLIWTPQVDRQQVVQSIMLILRDVTLLKKSEMERVSHQKELEYIIEVVNVRQEKFQAFMDSSFRFLAENDRLLRQNNRYDPEIIKIIFVNMHTIKGAARTLGLYKFTSLLHDVEHGYSELLKHPTQIWNSKKLIEQMTIVKDQLDYYLFINHTKLGRQSLSSDQIHIERDIIESQNLALKSIRRSLLPPADAAIINKAISTLEDLCFSSASDVFLEILSNAHKVAKDLGKEHPVIEVNAEGFKLNKTAREVLSIVFVHIIRNSLDHGIESADERVARGKLPTGHIHIDLTKKNDELLIQYYDDGRGLNLRHLAEKGRQSGRLAPHELEDRNAVGNLIFVSGISTAGSLTEVSGRGVGMDAVRRYLEEKGGSISLDIGPPEDGFAPFKLNLVLTGPLFVTDESLELKSA